MLKKYILLTLIIASPIWVANHIWAANHTIEDHAAANLPAVNIKDGFAELVQAVKPAVVNISTTTTRRSDNGDRHFPRFDGPPELEEFFRRFFDRPDSPRRPRPHRRSTAVGSGFIIAADGLVVTNHHVIDGADEIEVVFDDGTRIPAKLKGFDSKTDLALLEIKAGRDLPFVKFGDSESARVGDWVIAIGNPFGLGGTTTSGIISARGRDINSGPLDDFIQIDAPINRGNSGGPLFNIKGEVIGVNSAIYSPTGGSVGIGFAIPSSMASNVIAQLRDSGVVQRGFLGVQIQQVNAEIAANLGLEKPYGALVAQVFADSPAEKAGLKAGDVILRYADTEVSKMRDLPKLVALTKKETTVEIVIWRNQRQKTLRVEIGGNEEEELAVGTSPSKPTSELLGLSVSKINDTTRKRYELDDDARGVVVTAVDIDSAAAQRGLQVGDVIKRVGSREINTPKDFRTALKNANEDGLETVLLLIEKDRRTRFVVVPLESDS